MMYKQTFFGKIPIHWEIMTLNEIGVIKGRIGWRGYTVEDLRETGPYVIGAGDITSKNTIDLSKAKHLSIEKYEESPEIILEKGDSIIVKVGSTIGKVGYFDFDNIKATINPNSVLFRTTNLDSSFVYYYLCTRFANNYLISNSPASAQPAINQSTIKKMPVIVPPLNEQIAIANILSSLDDKIEINNKINSNLEEFAQTLYKRWFVDFEFPNEEGKPYKSSGGEMVESELGLIPKGWEVFYLDKLFSFERGVEPGSKNYSSVKLPGYVPFIRVGDLESKSNNYVSINLIKDKTCMEEDVLVSFDGAVGRVAMGHEGAYSTGIRKIHSFVEDIDFSFTYLLFKSQFIQDQIQSYANGTTIMHAGSSIKHLIAPLNINLIAEFGLIIRPMIKQMLNNMKQNESLALTRDLLLPKLMSGEVEV